MKAPSRLFKKEIAKVVLPSLLAMVLFLVAIFGVGLPIFKKNLLEEKKKTITAVTQTAWDVLIYYEQQAKAGLISTGLAKKLAMNQLRELHYGPEKKDYFWINDLQHKMIMHAYRPDLEGQDLSTYSDSEGKHVFKEFVQVAQQAGSGYVDYTWQWKDDPKRIVPKTSYVLLFKPWGWVIGTGMYTEDVMQDIAKVTNNFINLSFAIFMVILILSTYIMQKSLKEMRQRLMAEGEVYRYQNHLEELVEKRTNEFKQAMTKVKTLSGLLPICASCKKIRDDNGYWNQIESYIRQHSGAEFSHGICPECAKKLYPELDWRTQ